MRIPKWLYPLVVLFAFALQSGVAYATPEFGWWWNPDEGGRGFFIESRPGTMFMAGYFYESDGRATWLSSGGPNTDPYSWDGRLQAYRAGQTLLGDYKPPSSPVDAGAVSLRFTDDTHGTITWPGGVIPIERFRFGGARVPGQATTGWWWNPDESGSGYSIEVRGDQIFVVAFMYDDAGNPVWYYSSGKMASQTTYQGAWVQFANGQSLNGPYHPPSAPVTVGQLSVEFTAIDKATLTFSGGTTANVTRVQPKAGNTSRSVPAQTLNAYVPDFTPPLRYTGQIAFGVDIDLNETFLTEKTTVTVNGHLVWEQNPDALSDIPGPNYRGTHYSYRLTQDSKLDSITGRFSFNLALGAGSCVADLQADPPKIDGSTLEVNSFSEYTMDVQFHILGTWVNVLCSTLYGSGLFPSGPADLIVEVTKEGLAFDEGIEGIYFSQFSPLPEVNSVVSAAYHFVPVNQ